MEQIKSVQSYENSELHEHTVQGMKFIITPVFHQGGAETIGEILLKLIKTDKNIKI